MIGFLHGKLLIKQPPHLLIDVGGVGYELETSMTTFYTLPEVGEAVSLFIHTLIREDAQQLFGFKKEQERYLFRSLIKINGVGAKIALAILSGMDTQQFKTCILNSDMATLSRIPGIGKRTAERLIVEMRDRFKTIGDTMISQSKHPTGISTQRGAVEDAISGLIALGYKPREAEKYVSVVATAEMESEEIIRAALKSLVK